VSEHNLKTCSDNKQREGMIYIAKNNSRMLKTVELSYYKIIIKIMNHQSPIANNYESPQPRKI